MHYRYQGMTNKGEYLKIFVFMLIGLLSASALANDCDVTLRGLNELKISNRAPTDLAGFSFDHLLAVFTTLAIENRRAPFFVLLKTKEREIISHVAGTNNMKLVKDHVLKYPGSDPGQISVLLETNYFDKSTVRMSEVKSIQLIDRESLFVKLGKSLRFSLDHSMSLNDIMVQLSEGNKEALSFLGEIVEIFTYHVPAESKESEQQMLERKEVTKNLAVKSFLIGLSEYNIGGLQLVLIKKALEGNDFERAYKFIMQISEDPIGVIGAINKQKPETYPHVATVPGLQAVPRQAR